MTNELSNNVYRIDGNALATLNGLLADVCTADTLEAAQDHVAEAIRLVADEVTVVDLGDNGYTVIDPESVKTINTAAKVLAEAAAAINNVCREIERTYPDADHKTVKTALFNLRSLYPAEIRQHRADTEGLSLGGGGPFLFPVVPSVRCLDVRSGETPPPTTYGKEKKSGRALHRRRPLRRELRHAGNIITAFTTARTKKGLNRFG